MSREQIILKYAPLVKYVAGRIHMKLPPSVDPEDLYQSGILGLIDAVAKFDPSRGFKFQTYAEFRIRGAIIDELRSMDWVPRAVRQSSSQIEDAYLALELKLGRPASDEEVARHLGVSLAEYFAMLDESRSISIVSFDDIRTMVEDDERDIMEVLADPDAEDALETVGLKELRKAMSEAIGGLPEKERLVITLYYFEELTMSEIGHVLKLTESRISQLHSKAALRIRARIRRYMG
ncbi:MAG: FliA/WhiG family RNA polymerase sigma factor [Magnetococcales bacterium]|nr:FliA/WhiG family RNA polymerase sigma factor [Magnetococcales bacterium]NGZ26892.1 FliA/WhiG family RNA polymerase sigma factor [Magnetococcales bacterium]